MFQTTVLCGSLLTADAQVGSGPHAKQTLSGPACGESFTLAGHNAETVSVENGSTPGATDPMRVPAGRYTFLADHGVLAFTPTGSSVDAKYYTTDNNPNLKLNNPVTLHSSPWDPKGDGPPPVFAAAGHFLTPDHDDVAVVNRHGRASQTAQLSLRFLGKTGSINLPGTLLARQPDSTDFVALTHADLDHAADANGNLHDELIVARVENQRQDGSGRTIFAYSLDVLSYGAGNHAEITHRDFTAPAPQFTTDGTNTTGMLASGNILAIATGDFDGDGRRSQLESWGR